MEGMNGGLEQRISKHDTRCTMADLVQILARDEQ
jgi:hypothetical protein